MQDTGWPPVFTLDQERILTLLTGDRFYSNPSAALREAVLNAVDATQRRRVNEPELEPSIQVRFAREELTVSIQDNGIGMGQEAVTSLFAKVGASAASGELATRAVGEFGIGVVSYFMAGDSFTLQTFDGTASPIGLGFHRTMLAGETAVELSASRNEQGTTVVLQVKDGTIFDTLLSQFPHWFRNVAGLVGSLEPDGTPVAQGAEALGQGPAVGVTAPDWVERATLRPVSSLPGWERMTGISTVAVLYRGVFVQEFSAEGIWGIEGSIDVDPKHFRPRLNREGFVMGQFQAEVEAFLRDAHPAVLLSMAERLKSAIEDGNLSSWDAKRWANLWLSVPREPRYAEAFEVWDAVFRALPAFERATPRGWEPASFEDLLALGDKIYVAPQKRQRTNEIVEAAVKFLRNTGQPMIRGIERDAGWMKPVPRPFATTADLIAGVFSTELPELVAVASKAEDILDRIENLAPLFTGPPRVDIVRLGPDSIPALRLRHRLLINADHPAGNAIASEVLDSNSGPLELIGITARHAYEQLTQVAAVVREAPERHEVLGPVRRQYVRSLLS